MSAAALVPPQAIEEEDNVLGACLLSPRAIEAVSEVLAPDDFYRTSSGLIFRAALDLHGRGDPVDALTLADELETRGQLERVGGKIRLHELARIVPAAGNAAHYARIVRETARIRAVLAAGHELVRLGVERDGLDSGGILERAEQMLFELAESGTVGEFAPLADTLKEAYERVTLLHEQGKDVVGLPSGLAELDRLTGGFQPGNLVILAARPSLGKSAMMLGFAAHATVRLNLPVALFTLEMSRAEVTQRLMSMEGSVESQKLRNGRLDSEDWDKLNGASGRLANAPLFIEDSGLVTVTEIRSKARRLKLRHPNLALVCVDYLQLMTAQGENRVQEVSTISRGLKVLAGELDVPVLALSQLSRQPEQRHDKRPILSDLRESGSLEQDSDLVLLLYRDEVYNPEDPSQAGIAEIALSKHRNGPTGTFSAAWVARYARFGNLARVGDIGGAR